MLPKLLGTSCEAVDPKDHCHCSGTPELLRGHYGAMDDLPDDIDPTLWIKCRQTGDQDYLVERNPHAFPGRMAAFCPHDPTFSDYNVSIAEIGDCSAEARCA